MPHPDIVVAFSALPAATPSAPLWSSANGAASHPSPTWSAAARFVCPREPGLVVAMIFDSVEHYHARLILPAETCGAMHGAADRPRDERAVALDSGPVAHDN